MPDSITTLFITLCIGFSLGIIFFMVFKDHIVGEIHADEDKF
ncbi:MAG TPA: hypothetical protein PKM63_09725 [Panacibacter sp.]|nr:hypothetical protein [Panacibacter sp.]HNP44552.1 hypothetical protein [Panacibacter sp.]